MTTTDEAVVTRVKALEVAWTNQTPEQLAAEFFANGAGICGEGMPALAQGEGAVIEVLKHMLTASPKIGIEVKAEQTVNDKAVVTWLHWHTFDVSGNAGPVMRSLTVWAEQQGWRIVGDMFTFGEL